MEMICTWSQCVSSPVEATSAQKLMSCCLPVPGTQCPSEDHVRLFVLPLRLQRVRFGWTWNYQPQLPISHRHHLFAIYSDDKSSLTFFFMVSKKTIAVKLVLSDVLHCEFDMMTSRHINVLAFITLCEFPPMTSGFP